jgi:hypothetical protein
MNNVQAALGFMSALFSGSASFYVTISGTKHLVTLTKNGAATAPNLSAIVQLSSALVSATLTGQSSAQVKIGANNWDISVA